MDVTLIRIQILECLTLLFKPRGLLKLENEGRNLIIGLLSFDWSKNHKTSND